ncbi:DUF418 domain-containing protein [Sphingomonas sp. CJ99]
MTELAGIAPVRGADRIAVLDILRGVAILFIFYMNIPFQAAPTTLLFDHFKQIGWTPLDQAAWFGVTIYLEGTQRCLLELLFGAGLMLLARRAMVPDGPVAIADLYYRRTMWLILFGLIDIFLILWVGDILFVYALAAMFLFPFRLLGPRVLIGIGLAYALLTIGGGSFGYVDRTGLIDRVEAVAQKQARGEKLSKDDIETAREWNKVAARRTLSDKQREELAEERKAHSGSALDYAQYQWQTWMKIFIGKGALAFTVIEAFFTMLIGMALFKWGVIQGDRSRRFYLILMLAAYAVGLSVRTLGAIEVTQFGLAAKTIWFTNEVGRLTTTIGHLALINWAAKSALGLRLLGPAAAAGKTAFSLYFLTQIIGIHILFAPYGLNLWGTLDWWELLWVATAVIALLLILANVWLRFFAAGPLEWVWRSLSYVQRQPFRRRTA